MSSDVYIPKNEKEGEYLQKVREQKLVLGKKLNYFADEKIDGESLNDIIEEMLTQYLKLNVVVEKKSWSDLKSNFKAGNIDILNFLTYSEKRSNYSLFTDSIIEENLIVVSRDKKMNTLEDLNDMLVYVTRDTIYETFLKRFINKNDLTLKYSTLDDVEIEKKYPYVTSDLNAIGEKHTLNLGRIPGSSIGISKKYPELANIINSCLEEKYRKRIDNWVQKRQELIFKNKIDEVLTEEEKNYLKQILVLNVGYRQIDSVSRYSSEENRYIGVVPRILYYLSERLGIEIKEKNQFQILSWEDTKNKFQNKEMDLMILSKRPEREEELVFTQKITDLKFYEIKNLEVSKNFKKEKIGVLKGSVEESVAKEYFPKKNISLYSNENRLMQDFKNKRLSKILTLNINRYDITAYDVNLLETLPINIALRKEDVILRDIFNKALDKFINIEEVSGLTELARQRREIKQKKADKNTTSLVALFCIFLGGIAMYQTFKSLVHKNKNKELLRDELTGLYSRRLYNEFCKNNKKIEGYAVLLDLNNFKTLNDSYGHDYGDKVLIEVAKNLSNIFSEDYVFRISGDEFYIFTNFKHNLKSKLEILKKEFKTSNMLRGYNISFSLGYYYKKENISMIEAFKYADMAMYSAKRKKEEWYEEATEALIQKNKRRIKIENLLQKNLDKEFYPVFQKKYELETGKIIGAEALTRWESKELGKVAPDEFIQVAEELGVIYKIDYKIAENAMKEVQRLLLQKMVSQNFRMSFNMSAETFRRKDSIDIILNLLDKYSLKGENLELEITESMFLEDHVEVSAKLKRLGERGIYISIDDFTAGYSTVGLLATLPIDVVKFDKSLILNVSQDSEKGKSIYIGLMNMIKSLELKVVAEGIELEEQFQFLKDIGILYGQGYYLNKPEKGVVLDWV
ncbi:MAG: EAL domain-containing protein [Cetobacterium sp.]